MKKTISILTAMLLVITLLPMGAFAKDDSAAWDGTTDTSWYIGHESETEYNISTASQLAGLASIVNRGNKLQNKTINLTADIDLNSDITFTKDGAPEGSSPQEWTAIGTQSGAFEGTFNGNNHNISGVYMNKPNEDYQSFFGRSKGIIKNLGIINSYINGSYYVGGVCGYNDGTIEYCYNTGSVSGIGNCVGGVSGDNDGTIENCYNTGSVSGYDRVGGTCGENDSIIESCYNTGSVSGNSDVGGVCGDGVYISNCYNTGSVSGNYDVGGICGENDSLIENCYNTGSVSGNSDVGGVCGDFDGGTIENSYYNTETIGSTDAPTQAVGDIPNSDTLKGLTTAEMKCKGFADTLGYHFKYDSTQNEGYPIFDLVKTITNEEELISFRDIVNNGERCQGLTINLTTDIDLNPGITFTKDGAPNGSTPQEWTAIGTEANDFGGTFNGNKHTISGVYINQPSNNNQGFFGISSGTIQNLGVINSYINGNYSIGGVCGLDNGGTIENCYNTGSIFGTGEYVGGLCGYGYFNTIKSCYNTGSVFGLNYVGGVCGVNGDFSKIKNCYNTGSVSGQSFVGGVCGYDDGTIDNCYYNTETIGSTNAPTQAIENIPDTDTVKGLTTAVMQADNFVDKFTEDFRHTIAFKNCDEADTKYFGGVNQFSLPMSTKTGYAVCWYDNENCTGNAITEITTNDTGNKTFYAKFTAINYNVTVTQVTGGNITVSPESAIIGETVTITATPDSGYKLKNILVDGTAITSSTFVMKDNNATVTAEFEKVNYNVKVTQAIGGNITVSPETTTIGDTVTVTATPNSGYKLKNIIVDGTAITSSTFVMKDNNATVTAEFEKEVVPAESNKDTTSPQTGDNNNMILWVALLFISGGATFLTIYTKRKKVEGR